MREEIEVLVSVTRAEPDGPEKKRLLREILRLFNKLAHRKYAAELAATREVLERFAEELEEPQSFRAGLARVLLTAARRTRAPEDRASRDMP